MTAYETTLVMQKQYSFPQSRGKRIELFNQSVSLSPPISLLAIQATIPARCATAKNYYCHPACHILAYALVSLY